MDKRVQIAFVCLDVLRHVKFVLLSCWACLLTSLCNAMCKGHPGKLNKKQAGLDSIKFDLIWLRRLGWARIFDKKIFSPIRALMCYNELLYMIQPATFSLSPLHRAIAVAINQYYMINATQGNSRNARNSRNKQKMQLKKVITSPLGVKD